MKKKNAKGRGRRKTVSIRNDRWRAFALLLLAILMIILVMHYWEYLEPFLIRALDLVWSVKKDVIDLIRHLFGTRTRKD